MIYIMIGKERKIDATNPVLRWFHFSYRDYIVDICELHRESGTLGYIHYRIRGRVERGRGRVEHSVIFMQYILMLPARVLFSYNCFAQE